jgi:hypothetical protein
MASGLVNVLKLAEQNERDAVRAEGVPQSQEFPNGPEYRAISSSAVSCLALGVLSVLALLDWWMLILPVVSISFGLFALRQIRQRGDELTGAPLAKIGLALAVVCLLTGTSRLSYVYATEVPEGYARIQYTELQPVAKDSIEPPPSALALEGQKVFIKGFVYPSSQVEGIRTFLLVRDEGTCCFGGDPKINERIQVTLADPKGMKYATGLHKVAGVFHIRPAPQAVHGPGGIIYHLDEAILR